VPHISLNNQERIRGYIAKDMCHSQNVMKKFKELSILPRLWELAAFPNKVDSRVDDFGVILNKIMV
jgi:hypothetical protein